MLKGKVGYYKGKDYNARLKRIKVLEDLGKQCLVLFKDEILGNYTALVNKIDIEYNGRV